MRKRKGRKKQSPQRKSPAVNHPLKKLKYEGLDVHMGSTQQEIMQVLSELLTPDEYNEFTKPVLHYLCFIITNQNDPTSRTENRVEFSNVLTSFFTSLGLNSDYVPTLIQTLETKQILRTDLPSVKSEVNRLATAVNFERTLEEERVLRETSVTTMNYNEEIDWDEEKLKELEDKRLLKKQKVEHKKRLHYEKYLKESMISKKQGMIRMHHTQSGTANVEIKISDLSIGTKELLNETSFKISEGRRYGMVGRNGCGKTTLLRGLSERMFENIPTYLQILHVEQEAEMNDLTALQCLLATDIERENLLQREEEILKSGKDEHNLEEIYERMNEIDAYSAEAKASEILSGLSFSSEMQKTKLKNLSGGWRKRVAIARALFIEPDILLLDEPTNHLDLHAVIWLESFLLKFKKSLVIVSHSKEFLNNVSQSIIHFHEMKLTYYKGNYYAFENIRRRHLSEQERSKEAQDRQKKHIQKFIDRFRYKTFAAKMVQSRIKVIQKMKFIPSVVEDENFRFVFPVPQRNIDGIYLQVSNLEFGYTKDCILFNNVNMVIAKNSRIALLGKNGVGKTTLIDLILGKLKAEKGEIQRNPLVDIVKFSQHHADQLDLAFTPIEYMKKLFPSVKEDRIRSHLGRMGLMADTQLQPIYTLSGGQKSRVVFAEISFKRPNLLLLDEPTNHLDDALVLALNSFEGAVVIISHDAYLIKRVCDALYVMENDSVKLFDGDFDKYKKQLEL